MELNEIQDALNNEDYQYRLKALIALKEYDTEIAVPLLISKCQDPEFLVRSFVAMGLGNKRNADSFAALLEMMKRDRDTNVKAEASNSLAMYGEVAVSHLVLTFYQNSNWLVRRSILAAMLDLNSPKEMLEICLEALKDEDITVIEAGIDTLGTLASTDQKESALVALLPFAKDPAWNIRMHVAYALRHFDTLTAKEALQTLQMDNHHRVVAAALEGVLQEQSD